MKRTKESLNEVINVNGNKVFVENGEIKKILNENNEPTNYIDIESAFDIINKDIDKIYQNEL